MKKLLYAVFVLLVPFILVACNGDAASNDNDATTETDTGSSDLEVVILYSNAVSDGRGEWLATRAAAEIGIDLQIVDAGGVDIANRIIEERNAPQADVVFGLNQILWFDLIANEAITPYVPAWASEVPSHLNHADGYFHAVALVGNLLAYNVNDVDTPPTDWLDLWNNESFHGRFATPNALGGSTVQMILSGIFTRFLDEDGHLGISDEGWENIRGLFTYGISTDQDLFAEWVNPSNDVAMSQIWHMGIAPREVEFDVTVGLVTPEVGIPFSVEGVALINGTDNIEASQRFIDWFGSAEVMNDFGAEFNYLPAHPNALDGLPEFTIEISQIPGQDINWDVVAPNMGSWIEHIILNYLR